MDFVALKQDYSDLTELDGSTISSTAISAKRQKAALLILLLSYLQTLSPTDARQGIIDGLIE